MAMSAAEARASSSTPGSTSAAASCSRVLVRRGLREAMAEATATPYRWAGVRAPPCSTDWRLSLMSFAGSAIPARSVSRALTSARHQRRLALLPVAGAELVGLEGVQHPQHLVHVAAHRQVVDRDEA